jgi:transposase
MLEQGLSLAEIGRKLDLHESTVSYWLRKHGLEATHRAKHAARGGLSRAELEPMVEAGMSASQIADLVGLSKTTVRHWLREHGLQTQWAKRRTASNERREGMMLRCPTHGETTFRLRGGAGGGGGYRCARCRAEAVVRRRRKVKRLLVEEGEASARYVATTVASRRSSSIT